MNVKQLEEIREHANKIEECLDRDTQGSKWIQDALTELNETIAKELKNLVFQKYLKRRTKSEETKNKNIDWSWLYEKEGSDDTSKEENKSE